MKVIACKLCFISSLMFLIPSNVVGQVEDWEEIKVVPVEWWGGRGLKTLTICPNEGDYVIGIANRDLGGNNQVVEMICSNISPLFFGSSVRHGKSLTRPVDGGPGKGQKQWAFCPQGTYLIGLQMEDFGNNNQAIVNMRCSSIGGMTTVHGNSYEQIVRWSGGKGRKTPATCKSGFIITGIRNRDHGNNNQSVAEIRCTQPRVTKSR